MQATTFDPTQRAKDEVSALHALYEKMMDGWNAGSGSAFAAVFAEDGDLVAFDGSHLKGREEIASFHGPLFRTHLRGTRLVGRVETIRFLGPDVALLHARGGTLRRERSEPARERDSIQTLVATKEGDAWRVRAFQNTRVRPIGRSFGGTLVWLFTDWLWRILGPKA